MTTHPRLLIQAGHVAPREPGFEAGTGTVREQELALAVQTRLARLLATDGRWDVTLSPGNVPDGWRGDVFLSLHGDGAASPSASGFCYGYPAEPPSRALALLLRHEYERIPGHPPHRSDNYTRNLAGYYGFRRVHAPARVLIEHGFLTNPAERDWLFGHLREIAEAHYRALCRHFNRRPVALRAKPAKSGKLIRVDVEADGRRVNTGQPASPALMTRLRKLISRAHKIVITRSR